MCEFSKEDVLTLARLVLEDSTEYDDEESWIDNTPVISCKHCGSIGFRPDDVEHESNCPVLIAQDILTRNE